jgi:hypothetical protein
VAQPDVRYAPAARGAHRSPQGHVARRLLVVAAALALAAAACGGGSGAETSEGGGNQTTTTTKAPPVAPLTGLPDPSGEAQGRPVLSVKVENTPQARPQAGIEAADVVWDEVVEGQITRLLAMFQSRSTDVVGPIRSVRLTDPLIVWPVGGVFAFSGGAKYATDAIAQAPVTLVDEANAGDAMFRDPARRAPQNLFGRPAGLFAKGGRPVPPPPLFPYRARGAAPAGEAAASASVGFARGYDVTYTWDPGRGVWMRSSAAGPFKARSGEQIAPTNVVVLKVVYAGGLGEIGAEAQLVGQGEAVVLTGGHAVTGTWSRADKAAPIALHDAAGAPIAFTPGSTWVELPDVSYPVTVVPAAPPTG